MEDNEGWKMLRGFNGVYKHFLALIFLYVHQAFPWRLSMIDDPNSRIVKHGVAMAIGSAEVGRVHKQMKEVKERILSAVYSSPALGYLQ